MYKEIFAKRIREERIKKGKSQSEIAKELNTTQTTIAKYENGKLEPKIENICNIANALNCSIDYLMGRTDIVQTAQRASSDQKVDVVQNDE